MGRNKRVRIEQIQWKAIEEAGKTWHDMTPLEKWKHKQNVQRKRIEQEVIKRPFGMRQTYAYTTKHLTIQQYFDKKSHEGNLKPDFQPQAPQKRHKQRQTSIYGLADPDSKLIRYVGKSNKPESRYEQHLQDTDGPKSAWIKNLLAQGKRPVLQIIEVCDYAVWEDKERFWIAHYRKLQTLFNRTAGGDQSYTERYTPTSSALQDTGSRDRDRPVSD